MKSKNLKMATIAAIILTTVLSLTYGFQSNVNAQPPRVPGVAIGEWFKYEVEAYLNSTDENATFPEDFILLGESVLTEISVSNVSASNVTYTMTYHFENGSQISKQYWVDVESGNGTLSMTFISANLTWSNPIYVSPEYENMTIDSVYYCVYAGGFREVVGMHQTEGIVEGDLHGHETLIFIWDRVKGALLEFNYKLYLANATYTYNATINARIIETNVWKKRLVGIWHGDWVKYTNLNLTIETTLNLTFTDTPEFLMLYNQTEWLINKVTYVNNSLITFEQKLHLRNGTEKTYIIQVDVISGEGNMTVPGIITPVWFVSANLEVGEKVFDTPWTPPEFSINRTEKIELFGVQRYVNVLSINITMNTESGNGSIYGVMKWDRFTGVLIEAEGYMHFENETDYANIWCSARINATSLWGETTHSVEVNGSPFEVTVFSNISVYGMSVNTTEKALIFRVRGLSGVGFCNVSIPKNLMWGLSWELYIDDQPVETFTVTFDDDYTYIYFEFGLSEHKIKVVSENIVPELSSAFFVIAVLLALSAIAAVRKRMA